MDRRTVFTILVLVPLIGLTIAARTTPKPASTAQPTNKTIAAVSTKPPSKTNNTKTNVSKTSNTNVRLGTRLAGTKKVITTRLGTNGNAEEQCECTVFYLCDQNDVVTLPEGSTNTCPGNDVCCAIPITLVTDDPLSGIPTVVSVTETAVVSTSENSVQVSVSTQSTNLQPACVCVAFYQCPDYDPLTATGGAGLLDVRIPFCEAPDVCCPPQNVITPTPSIPPTENTPVPTQTVTPQTMTPPSVTPSPEECGFRRGQQAIDTRIVSPEAAMQTIFGEFPWMALILTSEVSSNNEVIENVFVCGASLLSPFIVLTAAHCVNEANISLLKVRVGEYDTHRGSEEPRPHQDRLVRAIHVHPNFHSKVLFNDLALLSVEEPFELAPHVSPICVPLMNSPYAAPNSYNPSNCIATGWGKNAFAEGSFQTTLRKVDLAIIPREQCQTQLRSTRLGQFFNLDPSFICAGGRPGFDTCQGDGGGPLFCALNENPNRYVQVGIVSWGIGCANSVPGVYASLEANRDWLSTEFNTMTVFRRPT